MTQDIIIIGQGVIIVLVGAVIKGVFAIKAELAKLNGRLGKSETWQEGHEELDKERFKTVEERLDRLRTYMREKE